MREGLWQQPERAVPKRKRRNGARVARNGGKEYILIDGHTRKCAWESLGNKTIPCIIHNFASLEEAKTFAIKDQINRRSYAISEIRKGISLEDLEKSLSA